MSEIGTRKVNIPNELKGISMIRKEIIMQRAIRSISIMISIQR
jgi:hypothetical protein